MKFGIPGSRRAAVYVVATALGWSFGASLARADWVAVATSFDCPDFRPSIAWVEPDAGRRVVSFGPVATGSAACSFAGTGTAPERIYAIGADRSGRVLLTDSDGLESRLLRIEPATSTSSVVSGCSVSASSAPGRQCGGSIVGSGVLGTLLGGIVVVDESIAPSSGLAVDDILVAVSRFEPCQSDGYAILRIDPSTGNRTTLSGLDGDCATTIGAGDPFVEPNGLAQLADGRLLVADGDSGVGRLVAVDPIDGDRTVLSGCTTATIAGDCVGPILGAGPVPTFVRDVVSLPGLPPRAVARADFDAYCGAGESGGLIVFEIDTGDRSVLSGRDAACNLVGAGPHFKDLEGVARRNDGLLAVSEDSTARILTVDPATGERRVASGCADFDGSLACIGPILGSGPAATNHGGLVALPESDLAVAVAVAVASLGPLLRRRRPARFAPRGVLS